MREIPTPSVLVVDDESLIRWSLSQGLTDAGFTAHVARDAAEARAILAGGTAMVIVLDLRLPDVTTLSFLREVRTNWPTCPVIMMSAHGTAEDARRAMEMGAFKFVDKPFDVGEMVGIVHAAWDSRG